MFFGECVNIVAQSFSQLHRTKTVDVSRILGALGAPSTRTDLQAFTSLLLLISTHCFGYCHPGSLQSSKDSLGMNYAKKWKKFNYFNTVSFLVITSKYNFWWIKISLFPASFECDWRGYHLDRCRPEIYIYIFLPTIIIDKNKCRLTAIEGHFSRACALSSHSEPITAATSVKWLSKLATCSCLSSMCLQRLRCVVKASTAALRPGTEQRRTPPLHLLSQRFWGSKQVKSRK